MTKRKPHKDEAITGIENVEKYFETHENKAKTHFGKFLNQIENYELSGKFLEIGPGPSILTAIMIKKFPNAEFTAVEISKDMIDLAKKYLEGKGYNNKVHFIEGNVYDEKLMKSLGKFDFVYSTYSLHHWQDPVNAFRIIYNSVLADKGLLVIHDLRRVNLLYHLPIHNGIFNSIRAAYTPKEIKTMFNDIGIRNYTINTPFPFMTVFIKI